MKRLFLFISCLMLLSGCTFKSGDELLKAPKPSATYESLQKQINSITSKGAIAVSPQSGENRNTVQLKDLDLDGEDEAVAFFCETKNPDKFHVYVFRRENEEYVPVGCVSSAAAHITSVSYPAISSDGTKCILISWKLSGDTSTSGMTVCAFSNEKLITLLETTYQSSITTDLDNDGTIDLILFNKDETNRKTAQLYTRQGSSGKLTLKGESILSPETQDIVSLKEGLLRGYQPAVFAESKVELSAGLMTDIFVYDNDGFRNITLESEDGMKHSTYRPISVPSSDVNYDHLTEVPLAVPLPSSPQSSSQTSEPAYMLDWYAFSTGDAPVRVCSTYQNVSENWQFMFPEAWRSNVTVVKSTNDNETKTTFLDCTGNEPAELFTIHRLTGDMRNYYASQKSMSELTHTATEIYTVSIGSADSRLKLTAEQINERFSTIFQSWNHS